MSKKKFKCELCGNKVEWIQPQKASLERALALLSQAENVLENLFKDESFVQEVIIEYLYLDDLDEAIESVKKTRGVS